MSVAGMSLSETLTILRNIGESAIVPDLLEINLSCPNLPGKPQIGYDFDQLEETLRVISDMTDTLPPWGVKLPPYLDPVFFGEVSDRLLSSRVSFLTSINSIGNALWIDPLTQQSCIAPKKGLGGLGGRYVKPTALANVFQFYRHVGHHIDIVGCGGVTTGTDVWEHILAGASAVQVGTQ